MTILQEKIVESLFVTFKIIEKTVSCEVVYKSPFIDPESNKLFLQHLDEYLNTIGPNQTCLVMGGFNYDLLASKATDDSKNRFVDTMFDNFSTYLINHPTRIADSSATVLDHMWSSANSSCLIKSAIISDPISDHLPIICCASI